MVQSELIFKEGINNELRVSNVDKNVVLLTIKYSYNIVEYERIFKKEAKHPDDLDYELSFEIGRKEIPLLTEFLKAIAEE